MTPPTKGVRPPSFGRQAGSDATTIQMQPTAIQDPVNPTELEAQADELEAQSLLLRAQAKRLRAASSSHATTATPLVASADLDERAAAAVVGVSVATLKRANLPADYHAGNRPRWRDAESVRAKFAARGKKPTTPHHSAPTDGLDVDALASRAGLRAVSR